MIVSGHQPNYLPYPGFFDKVAKSDVFIIGDDAQFSYKDFHRRNKIRIPEGWRWLTVPVVKKFEPISQIVIRNDTQIKGIHWAEKQFLEIEDAYRKAPFFESYSDDLKKIYLKTHERLLDLNMDLIYFLLDSFEIDTEIVFASNYSSTASSTLKIVEMMEEIGADTYLSGIGGKNYLDLSLFKDIEVIFQDYEHPVYKQCFEGFEPYMASIDVLFNVGELPDKE